MILDSDVVVIGAGLSGLVTAFALARAGLRVQVIEAAPRTGGVISTVRRDGMLYERGPNSALDTHPRISELLDQLGIAAERVEASTVSSRRYVLRDGTPAALPTSPTAFFSTRLFSAAAKLRLLREPFIAPAPATADESVTQFVTRRLGHELLDYAIEPFVAGVYAGNPDELSVTAAFPKLYALEQRYGSLIKGQIKGARERARRDERAKNVAGSFSFRDGMQTLTDALTRALPTVLVDTMVTRLERTQRWNEAERRTTIHYLVEQRREHRCRPFELGGQHGPDVYRHAWEGGVVKPACRSASRVYRLIEIPCYSRHIAVNRAARSTHLSRRVPRSRVRPPPCRRSPGSSPRRP